MLFKLGLQKELETYQGKLVREPTFPDEEKGYTKAQKPKSNAG